MDRYYARLNPYYSISINFHEEPINQIPLRVEKKAFDNFSIIATNRIIKKYNYAIFL